MTFNEWMGKQGNLALVHANCCRIAYEAGQQSQQAKVEELQKQLSEYIFVAETIDGMYVKEVKSSEELQKRVDAALKETQFALQYVEDDMRGNHEFLKMAMIRVFKDLEQALKGEG